MVFYSSILYYDCSYNWLLQRDFFWSIFLFSRSNHARSTEDAVCILEEKLQLVVPSGRCASSIHCMEKKRSCCPKQYQCKVRASCHNRKQCQLQLRSTKSWKDTKERDQPQDWRELENNQLQDLPQDIFSANTKLKALLLRKNLLKTLPQDIFRNNTQLEVLFSEENQLKDLQQDVFNANTKLVWLYLNDNLLRDLPREIFNNNVKLKQLWVKKKNTFFLVLIPLTL